MKIEDKISEFKKQLRLGGYSYNTIETYDSCATIFLAKFKDYKPTKSQIEDWLLTYSSEVYRKHLLVSVKCMNKILKMDINCETILNPRPESKLPEILSPQEMQKMFDVCENLKHRKWIELIYYKGARVSEIETDNSTRTIQEAIGHNARKAGIKKQVTPTMLRYSGIAHAIQNGIDRDLLAEKYPFAIKKLKHIKVNKKNIPLLSIVKNI